MRSPLVLTGGPAVGKSTTARLLASAIARAAMVDTDDVRQLIVSGGAAPWQGSEGLAQQRLGVENACSLARSFHAAGSDVILADVRLVEHAVEVGPITFRELVAVSAPTGRPGTIPGKRSWPGTLAVAPLDRPWRQL